MARLLGPDLARRTVTQISGGTIYDFSGRAAVAYLDEALTQPASIATYNSATPTTPGAVITGSKVILSARGSQLPLFWFPDGVDTLYVQVDGLSHPWTVTADVDARLDAGGGGSGQLLGWYDVTAAPYSAPRTGSADAAAGIQAALTACGNAGGGVVYAPAGAYLLQSQLLYVPANVGLFGDGAATRFLQAIWPTASGVGVETTGGACLINAAGSLGAKITCSAVAPKTSVITGIASTAGLASGDLIILGSNNAYWSTGYPSRYKGEMLRVESVDSASQVTVRGVVRDSYSASPGIYKLNPLKGVQIRDITLVNTEPGSTHATSMIGLKYTSGARITNVDIEGCDYTGVKVTSCYDTKVTGGSMQDFTDNVTLGQYGYGVMAELAAEQLSVSNVHFRRMRHGFTTGGIAGSYGSPRNVHVSDCVATECSNTAFDTHQLGSVTFTDCQVVGSKNAAFTSRSRDTRIVNPQVSYCATGAVVYGDSDGIGHGTVIQGGTFRHIYNDDAIQVSDADAVTVKGVTIDSCAGAGVYILGDASRLTVEDCNIMNTGLVNGSRKAGVEFLSTVAGTGHRITRNTFRNLAGGITGESSTTGGMTYAIRNNSPSVTGSWFVDNSCVGMVAGTILDVGNNVDLRNLNLSAPTSSLSDAGHSIPGRAETIPRVAAQASITLTSGTMLLGYLTPGMDIASASSLIVYSGTAASATMTLGRLGLYSVDASGNLTLVQGSASDTSLLAAANTEYVKAITGTVVARGVRLAVGILAVGTTAGSVRGASGIAALTSSVVRMAAAVTGQSDLPASVAVGSLTSSGNVPYLGVS